MPFRAVESPDEKVYFSRKTRGTCTSCLSGKVHFFVRGLDCAKRHRGTRLDCAKRRRGIFWGVPFLCRRPYKIPPFRDGCPRRLALKKTPHIRQKSAQFPLPPHFLSRGMLFFAGYIRHAAIFQTLRRNEFRAKTVREVLNCTRFWYVQNTAF